VNIGQETEKSIGYRIASGSTTWAHTSGSYYITKSPLLFPFSLELRLQIIVHFIKRVQGAGVKVIASANGFVAKRFIG
jgi:hypothetical protein